MIDKELFELCKQVYELLPDWGLHIVDGEIDSYRGDLRFYKNSNLQGDEPTIGNEPVYDIRYIYPVPLYTSDYLLERLPRTIEIWAMGTWHAESRQCKVSASTPLKTLLKLTLALNKAGVEL